MSEPESPPNTTDFIPADVDRATFLGDPVVDRMMSTLIALGAEVWTTRRRLLVIEHLLEEHGHLTRDMIEAYAASDEVEGEWRKARDAFIGRVFGSLTPAPGEPLGPLTPREPPRK